MRKKNRVSWEKVKGAFGTRGKIGGSAKKRECTDLFW